MKAPETNLTREQWVRSSPAAACANELVWRASVLLLSGMGMVLILVWDHALSLAVIGGTGSLWFLVTGFICFCFRDPEPRVPTAPDVFIAPAHGLVDVVDEASGVAFMRERCRRISISISVLDVHVQYAPTAGRVVVLERQPRRFLSALKGQSAQCRENVIIGIECGQGSGERVAVRQMAGVIARPVISWIKLRDVVKPGQRLGLIQFGSRCDLYLPLSAQVKVQHGDRVVGGETVVGAAAGRRCDQIQPFPDAPGVSRDLGTQDGPSLKSLRHPL